MAALEVLDLVLCVSFQKIDNGIMSHILSLPHWGAPFVVLDIRSRSTQEQYPDR
jgi:hypothetical protein